MFSGNTLNITKVHMTVKIKLNHPFGKHIIWNNIEVLIFAFLLFFFFYYECNGKLGLCLEAQISLRHLALFYVILKAQHKL